MQIRAEKKERLRGIKSAKPPANFQTPDDALVRNYIGRLF
jgi:hypothetical protein